jgi:hypothetical protein
VAVPPLLTPELTGGEGAAGEDVLPPLSPEAFEQLLATEDLEQLARGCLQLVQYDDAERLHRLNDHLLALHPAPQPLPVILANADVLLRCQAPEAALTVLDRYGPGPGPGRTAWLLLQWRAADAALDHRRAALALERLRGTAGTAALDAVALPLEQKEDGTVISRSALELLAAHLESRGQPDRAGEILLTAPRAGQAGAERLQEVVRLLQGAPAEEREALLEAALDQAAAVGAWGLAAELLDLQITLSSSPRALERRLRLSPRIDDAYGEWRLRRQDAGATDRSRELEGWLRSPRSPGGHAPLTTPPPSDVPPPP